MEQPILTDEEYATLGQVVAEVLREWDMVTLGKAIMGMRLENNTMLAVLTHENMSIDDELYRDHAELVVNDLLLAAHIASQL